MSTSVYPIDRQPYIVTTYHDVNIRFAVNTRGCNKDWNPRDLASGFRDTAGTIADVQKHIKAGHAVCAGLLGDKWRKKANVVGSQWILLDIDNSDVLRDSDGKPIKDEDGKTTKVYKLQLTLEEAIAHPFIQKYCALIYTTASHTPEWHKFRLVFVLPEFVSDIDAYEAAVRLLMEQLPHDPSCKDASRVFYGSTQAEFPLVNDAARLPSDWLEQARKAAQVIKTEAAQRQAEAAQKRAEFLKTAQTEGWDLDALIDQALAAIPPRQPGSGNYQECLQVLMALHEHYGAAKAEAIAESWSPSIKGDSWQVRDKLKSFRRSGVGLGTLFHIAQQYGFSFPERHWTAVGASPNNGQQRQDLAALPEQELKRLRKEKREARAREILNRSLPEAGRETAGGYVPELSLPAEGEGLALDADLGAGKTTAIGKLRQHLGFSVLLSPRNSLGKQTARKYGIPHIHKYKPDREQTRILGIDARTSGGMVLCPNSAQRASGEFPNSYDLIIDEVMATLTDALEGGTLGKRWSETVELLIELLRKAKHVIVAEANLDQATIRLIERLSGKTLRVIRHRRGGTPRKVCILKGGSPNTLRRRIINDLKQGKNLWVTTTSVDELRRWELYAIKQNISYRIICGETNDGGQHEDFFEEPDDTLEANPVQLILSNQSLQSGTSVERYPIEHVYGYAPGFHTEVIFQQLGRYRKPVPITVWVPAYIPPNRWEKPRKSSIRNELAGEISRWGGGFESNSDQKAINDYLAKRWESRWAQKMLPAESLQMMFEREGHHVTVETGEQDKEVQHLWKTMTEELARNRSSYQADLKLDPDTHTKNWAIETLNENESTHEQRCKARKVMMQFKFPGIDWDDAEIWYQAVFQSSHNSTKEHPSQKPLAPGATRWVDCDQLDYLLAEDTKQALELMAGRLKAAHLLPDTHRQASLLATFKPHCETLVRKGIADPRDPEVKHIAAMARCLDEELYRRFRIRATKEQSDIAIACKILRKFSLTLARHRLVTTSGKREWSQVIEVPDLWRELVEARQRAFQGVTESLKRVSSNSVTLSFKQINSDDWSDLLKMFSEAKQAGQRTFSELKRMVISAFSPGVWVRLQLEGGGWC